jgi:YfiH family protein
MRRIGSGPVPYYQFNSLPSTEISHAVFTRNGGVSPEPWRSLNVGNSVGDNPEHVRLNHERIFECLGRRRESLTTTWQVHSATVVLAERPSIEGEYQQADAMITNSKELTLVMRFADCVPILVYDPITGSVGIAHSGWIGTVKKLALALIRSMVDQFGSDPGNLLAGIGPSIGPDHYEVGVDVVRELEKSFGDEAEAHLIRRDSQVFLDLWAANQSLLSQAGVRSIERADICTACDRSEWYSHRGENGKTGRFAAAIGLSRHQGG